jgi:5-methyltetrahydrofolate--homocysteine methyltransferase
MTRLLSSLRPGNVLLMDGAMGSELYQAGLEPDECGEEWNLSRPERVRAIHEAYVQAGARCLLTNTFQANPCALVRHGLEEQLERIIRAGVRLARAAVGREGFVLADIGPILISPADQDFSDWGDLARTVEAFLGTDIDGILLETCSSPRALTAVEVIRHRILDHDDLPMLLSIAYRRHDDGRLLTHSGHSPETFARHAAHHGVSVLGVNCGRDLTLDHMADILRRYRRVSDMPLLARPNAGSPVGDRGQLAYPVSPESMAGKVSLLIDSGAAMLGGCCGTTPGHIAAIQRASLSEPVA